jgi:hypothetical protein
MFNYDLSKKRLQTLDKAIEWININIDYFDLSLEKHNKYVRLKSLVELSLFIGLYHRKFGITHDYRIEKIINFILKSLNNSNYIDRLMRMPALLIGHACIYSSLLDCGIDLKEYKHYIQKVANQNYVFAKERSPYRLLDLSYILGKSGIKHNLPNIKSLYKKTFLYRNPNVIFLDNDDVYSITHTIFYLSDFGFKKLEVPDYQLPQIKWVIGTLMGLYLIKKNWDILSELLICCHCLRWIPYPIYEIVLFNVLNTQRIDGSIPGPRSDENVDRNLDYKETYFLQNYHTTLVTSMTCLLIDEKSSSPPNQKSFDKNIKKNNFLNNLKYANERAYLWIKNLAIDVDSIDNELSLLHILLGEWIFSNFNDNMSLKNFISDATKIQQRFVSLYTDQRRLIPYPIISIIGAGILRKINIANEPLEQFIEDLSEILIKKKFTTLEEETKIFPVKFLLNRINGVPFSNDNIQTNINNIDMKKLYLEKDMLNYLLDAIPSQTLFGQRPKEFQSPILDNIRNFIASHTLHSLSEYNLDLGLQLLRVMNYLHEQKSRSFQQSLDFVLWQQQTDGKFGFFSPEISNLPVTSEINDSLMLYLPITTSAIWTLTEISNPSFEVFHSI